MNTNYILSQFLRFNNLYITKSECGGFIFEAEGKRFDGSYLCAEEAFIQALIFLGGVKAHKEGYFHD